MNWLSNIFQVTGLLFVIAGGASAGSLPEDWRDWKPVNTPLAEIGALPGCDADVSSLPPIYQRTVATYCNVRPEGPGAVAVLISGPAMSAYMARTGNFPDGSQTALHLKDMGILMVTTYEQGKPVYQVFSEKGEDITGVEGPLAAGTCSACHADAAVCVNGQCGTMK
ncbi:MAG: hypothetical protein LJE70_01855 [Chromatiaceae bacterium]|jgi:hypothetical protein|nr:hypothetical protein [Chromatiaceae bacterium]